MLIGLELSVEVGAGCVGHGVRVGGAVGLGGAGVLVGAGTGVGVSVGTSVNNPSTLVSISGSSLPPQAPSNTTAVERRSSRMDLSFTKPYLRGTKCKFVTCHHRH